MTAEVVPFGKYKGQPVEVLAADTDYCEWLTGQPWFRDRWPNVYNVVINYGGEPQDSPEHNQMQARFLDEPWCLALADRLGLRAWHGLDRARAQLAKDQNVERFRQHVQLAENDMFADEAEFEVKGWDVVYVLNSAWISLRMTSLPGCTCRCDHSGCAADAKCHGGDGYCRHGGHVSGRRIEDQPGKVRTDSWYHCGGGCPWRDGETGRWLERQSPVIYRGNYDHTVYVELKPDLGDDYPKVLRQVNGYPAGEDGSRCVVVRRAAFEHVTWDQVVRIFGASGVTLTTEQDIAKAGCEPGE